MSDCQPKAEMWKNETCDYYVRNQEIIPRLSNLHTEQLRSVGSGDCKIIIGKFENDLTNDEGGNLNRPEARIPHKSRPASGPSWRSQRLSIVS